METDSEYFGDAEGYWTRLARSSTAELTEAQLTELLDSLDVTVNPDDQGLVDDCYSALVGKRAAMRRGAAAWNARQASLASDGPDECKTCLGARRIRDGETGELRKCLDCNGSGHVLVTPNSRQGKEGR